MQVLRISSIDDSIFLPGFLMLTPNDTYSDPDVIGAEIDISLNEAGDTLSFVKGGMGASGRVFKYIALG